MSRSTLEQEANDNRHKPRRDTISFFLSEFPPTEWSIVFELSQDADSPTIFCVKIIPVSSSGERFTWRAIEFYLEDLPTIRAYLKQTGALKLFYDETKAVLDEQLAQIKETLLGDVLPRAPREISIGVNQGLSCGQDVKVEEG